MLFDERIEGLLRCIHILPPNFFPITSFLTITKSLMHQILEMRIITDELIYINTYAQFFTNKLLFSNELCFSSDCCETSFREPLCCI